MRRLAFNNERAIGINRSRVTVIESGNPIEYSRKSSDMFSEIERHLTEDITVINAIWGKNDRQNRQSPMHQEYALA